MLKAKATQLRLRLGLSQTLSLSLVLPVLFSQGLVLVLIKAVSFCLLPAFSTAYCELRGNTDTERRGKKVATKSSRQRKQARGYSAIQPARKHATSLQRPEAWNRVIIWHGMVPSFLAIFLHCYYDCCSFLPAAAFGLKRSWEARPVCSLAGCKSAMQPIEPHL